MRKRRHLPDVADQRMPAPRTIAAARDAPLRDPALRSGTPAVMTPRQVTALQRTAGNAAVIKLMSAVPSSPVVQRQFDDVGPSGEGTLGGAGEITQPDLAEAGDGGGELVAERMSEFGDFDGELTAGPPARVFLNRGQVATGKWHHCGGTGGKANEGTGTSTVVAPVYKSSPPKAPGGQAKAWVQKGTGKVKVSRSYNGVVPGNNGTAVWAGSGGGLVFIMWSGLARMATHERGHIKETKKFHDSDIKPMETRIQSKQNAATEAAAIAAMQAHVNWNATLAGFATKDTAMNAPGATFDTTDQAKADFYHDKGPKKINKTQYQHLIEAP